MMLAFAVALGLLLGGCDDFAAAPKGCCKQSASQCASPITKAQCDALDPPGDWVNGKDCDLAGDCV